MRTAFAVTMFSLAVACLALAGCATDGALVKEAPTSVQLVEVSKPCPKAEKVPTVPARATVPADPDETKEAAAASAYVYALEDYAKKADIILRACSQP